MRYSKLIWTHDSLTEPVEILSEHDDDGWERRKIEVFADGSAGYASASESAGGSALSVIPCPPDDEVVAEPEFRIIPLTPDEFEAAWGQVRRRYHRPAPKAEAG